jgi:hypothetical protein
MLAFDLLLGNILNSSPLLKRKKSSILKNVFISSNWKLSFNIVKLLKNELAPSETK